MHDELEDPYQAASFHKVTIRTRPDFEEACCQLLLTQLAGGDICCA